MADKGVAPIKLKKEKLTVSTTFLESIRDLSNPRQQSRDTAIGTTQLYSRAKATEQKKVGVRMRKPNKQTNKQTKQHPNMLKADGILTNFHFVEALARTKSFIHLIEFQVKTSNFSCAELNANNIV